MDSIEDLEKFKKLELKRILIKQKILQDSLVPSYFFQNDLDLGSLGLETEVSPPLISRDNDFFQFASPFEKEKAVRFKYHLQPDGTPGRKVALIFIMHWNGRLRPYDKIISFIRSTALPISTFIHIPAGRSLNPGIDGGADYEAVSPNINKVISTTKREINNIQIFAQYLKEKLGFDEVGLFTYSLGSNYASIASMTRPGLFDFGIFHMMADDFAEATMNGLATQKIAEVIKNKISLEDLKKYWSVISPGAYAAKLQYLPRHTRLIQCKYDFIFGRDNVKRITEKISLNRPDAEIVELPTTHTGLSSFPIGLQVMIDNIRFIYKYTRMKEYKRAKLFS